MATSNEFEMIEMLDKLKSALTQFGSTVAQPFVNAYQAVKSVTAQISTGNMIKLGIGVLGSIFAVAALRDQDGSPTVGNHVTAAVAPIAISFAALPVAKGCGRVLSVCNDARKAASSLIFRSTKSGDAAAAPAAQADNSVDADVQSLVQEDLGRGGGPNLRRGSRRK